MTAFRIDTRSEKFKGLTRKKYRQLMGKQCSEPGKGKSETCRATPLDKSMAKNPRAWKVYPLEYIQFNKKKNQYAGGNESFFDSL